MTPPDTPEGRADAALAEAAASHERGHVRAARFAVTVLTGSVAAWILAGLLILGGLLMTGNGPMGRLILLVFGLISIAFCGLRVRRWTCRAGHRHVEVEQFPADDGVRGIGVTSLGPLVALTVLITLTADYDVPHTGAAVIAAAFLAAFVAPFAVNHWWKHHRGHGTVVWDKALGEPARARVEYGDDEQKGS